MTKSIVLWSLVAALLGLVRDAAALAAASARLGAAARAMAQFDVRTVIARTRAVYRELGVC